ncbi:transposase [Novosphingobium resinovorum]|uniref:transposase n=1 Tax=Novosphingobium sp. HR1a TaxID=1395637 RepID=UPI001B3C760E|nr:MULTISPECIES: transposase [Novosphingobium]MBF7014150.1 transposase [Novosphingobium sp. HR1a]WJM25374.1 transposase [Novosphingobium resinovorum]
MNATPMIDAQRLSLMLNELRLPTIKHIWGDFAAQADKEGWPASRFLAALAEHELAERDRRRIERHLAEAHLPAGKTLDCFAFDAVPMISKAQVMALSTRLMAGLHLLKHMEGLSDEAVCARWVENPYHQFFCGEQHFRHKLPLDRSSMTRWRNRIWADKLELLLAETLRVAMETRAMPPQACERVTVDTTVQTNAIAHPTDSHLLLRGIEWLNRIARKHGIKLRQSFLRVGR